MRTSGETVTPNPAQQKLARISEATGMVEDAGGTVGALGVGGESVPVPLDEVPVLPGASDPGGTGCGVESAAASAGGLGSTVESAAASAGGLSASAAAFSGSLSESAAAFAGSLPAQADGTGTHANPPPGVEPKLSELMAEMQKMNLNLGQKIDRVQEHFENIQKQFEDLKKAVQDLKEDMVTKDLFQKLEKRVALLEKGGLPDKQMSWMNQQVNRSDPVNK